MSDREQAALGWFVRLRGAVTAEDRRDFAAWLGADAGSRGAFAEAEALWRRTDAAAARLAGEEAPALRQLLAKMDATRERRGWLPRLRPALAMAALVLAVVAGGIWLERPHLFQDLVADHVTGRGERRLVALPDGSTALLEADSAIRLDYVAGERRVALLRGAAFFSVVATGRPFVAAAAGGETHVLGTKFEVRLAGEDAVVTVAEGRVGVVLPSHEAAVLGAGQQIRYGPDGAGAVTQADLDAALAWQQGRLVFYRARMSEVVEALGRYHAGRIVILDDALADRRVTGSLAIGDADAALASLRAIVGFRRTSIAGHLVILR
jgi:transmembrane sensor